jgi:hypothetical protein
MKAPILIDDARPTYPVFYLGASADPAAVQVDVDPKTLKRWRSAAKLYATAQKQMEAAVNTYAPAAINKTRLP